MPELDVRVHTGLDPAEQLHDQALPEDHRGVALIGPEDPTARRLAARGGPSAGAAGRAHRRAVRPERPLSVLRRAHDVEKRAATRVDHPSASPSAAAPSSRHRAPGGVNRDPARPPAADATRHGVRSRLAVDVLDGDDEPCRSGPSNIGQSANRDVGGWFSILKRTIAADSGMAGAPAAPARIRSPVGAALPIGAHQQVR